MRSPRRTLLLAALIVAAVTGVVWGVQEYQSRIVKRSFNQEQGVQGMLTAMLDQETALRGYLETGDRTFLSPFESGLNDLVTSIRQLRVHGDDLPRAAKEKIDDSEKFAIDWHRSAEEAIFRLRMDYRHEVPLSETMQRKRMMDSFRELNAEVEDQVTRNREADLTFSRRLSVALVLLLAAVLGVGGWFLFGRPAERQRAIRRREHLRRDRQSEFARTMQAMEGEEETHALVKRHLERTIDDSTVVVMQRNNSADRLLATTELPTDHPLTEALVDAKPSTCLSIRLGSSHAQGDGDELLRCDLCGKTGSERALCTPLVVSGEVIGSVLVGHDEPLEPGFTAAIDETVSQAAPVLANMRNLAIAEARAATDALTGLANRRSVQDSIRRMVAHAARADSPMAVVAIDVDHFKRINDRHGHDRGDDVLAAVGQTLAGTIRSSDFVGRQGGEEFVALLPDTDLSGAMTAAEKLRAAIERLDVLPGGEPVTASFGIAVMPEDGVEPAALMRQADRALYAAKANGRNRVEVAASAGAKSALSG